MARHWPQRGDSEEMPSGYGTAPAGASRVALRAIGRRLRPWHSDWVLWAGFNQAGTLLGTGSYGEICLWDTESWELLRVLKRPSTEKFSTIAFSFSSDKEVFISGAWSHEELRHEVRDESGNLL